MRCGWFTLALLFALVDWTRADSPVHIPDPGLKAAIEDALWVCDPTAEDMLALTHLDAQARSIESLTGLEAAVNLQSLNLRFNHIRDVTPLGGLTDLGSLYLNDNEIPDVSPLGGLVNLYHLDLHDNDISDISALSGLVNVTFLALRQNPLSDISALSGMSKLADLSLLETQVSDISPLANLTSLRYVDLRDCPLNDEAYDVHIPQMMANNPGIEIETDPLRGRLLSLSSTYGGSVVEPGEGDFVYPFDTLVHLKAVADPGFVFAGWTGPFPIATASADIFTERNYQFKAHFRSLRDTLYVDNSIPADPNADGSPEHPIPTIQNALEVASDSVTVLVAPGVYRENINLLGKKVDLAAFDPRNPEGGPCVTIEGVAVGKPVVLLGAASGSQCSLSGFVITRGRGDLTAAIECSDASPRISHCLIVGNRCTDPNGAILRFTESRAAIIQCTIADNYAGENGTGIVLVNSSITMTNSIVWNNRPSEIAARGTSHPLIRYCCVRGWWPDFGNIHGDPLLALPGLWVDPEDAAKILTCHDPRAVWTDGDYRLQSQAGRWDPATCAWRCDGATSPAIDGGDPADPVGREPSPHGGIVNMGAYGGTVEASKSLTGI